MFLHTCHSSLVKISSFSNTQKKDVVGVGGNWCAKRPYCVHVGDFVPVGVCFYVGISQNSRSVQSANQPPP